MLPQNWRQCKTTRQTSEAKSVRIGVRASD